MHSVYFISTRKGVLPHFSGELTEARRQKTLAQNPARSPQLSSYKSLIVLTSLDLGPCLCSAFSSEIRLGCQEYLEGGGDGEAHEASAEMGLAQHSACGSGKHQPIPQELQVGSQPPERGCR